MRNFGHISAVRFYLDYAYSRNRDIGEKEIRVLNPEDPWHQAILYESYLLHRYAYEKSQKAVQTYKEAIRSRRDSDGRQIDPALPIQLGQGIIRFSSIVEEADKRLDDSIDKLDKYANKASFDKNLQYERAVRDVLSSSRKTVTRTRLYLHTYLWILWTQESLHQANQFAGLEEQGFFHESGEDSFSSVAHPPLIVATLSCTAMIEEIGAFYVNKLTSESINPDKTSCSRVMKLLEQEYPDIDGFDVDLIDDYVIDVRNDISHYITRRNNILTTSEFEGYCEAILEGLALVEELVNHLLADLLETEGQEFINPTSN